MAVSGEDARARHLETLVMPRAIRGALCWAPDTNLWAARMAMTC